MKKLIPALCLGFLALGCLIFAGGRSIPGGPLYTILGDAILHIFVGVGIGLTFPKIKNGDLRIRYAAFFLVLMLSIISALSISAHISYQFNPYSRGDTCGI